MKNRSDVVSTLMMTFWPRIVAESPSRKLDNLKRRDDFIVGDPEDLVHMDWSEEWHP